MNDGGPPRGRGEFVVEFNAADQMVGGEERRLVDDHSFGGDDGADPGGARYHDRPPVLERASSGDSEKLPAHRVVEGGVVGRDGQQLGAVTNRFSWSAVENRFPARGDSDGDAGGLDDTGAGPWNEEAGALGVIGEELEEPSPREIFTERLQDLFVVSGTGAVLG